MTRLAIVEGSGFIDEYSQAMARTTDARISVVVEAAAFDKPFVV